ncbi:MAG: DNA methyltransferase [Planctomycetota bacterium]
MNTEMKIEEVPVADIRPSPKNPRSHSKDQIRQIASSIEAFGFRFPVLIDGDNRLICGHARLEACKRLKLERMPAIRAADLSEAQLRALMIADNRLTEISTWDDRLLADSFKVLTSLDLDFDIEVTGFDYGEIEQRILDLDEPASDDEADEVPRSDTVLNVTRPGDLWRLGKGDGAHSVFCGDCTDTASYEAVLGAEKAAMVFTDPPYNLPASAIGSVCDTEHGDFQMAAGEMSPAEFTAFLGGVIDHLKRFTRSGSIHYLFMDHRHASEILDAGSAYAELKNICVWVKERAGLGTFYRSQHELVFVFKSGTAKHRNHFELGQHGRHRSNVWSYSSARSFDPADGDPEHALQFHPTIKPVRLIYEAILDVSRRNETVLDPFLGSGSTLIAAEEAGRRCAGIELEPRYVDVALARWSTWTGLVPILDATGQSLHDVRAERQGDGHVGS